MNEETTLDDDHDLHVEHDEDCELCKQRAQREYNSEPEMNGDR